MKDMYIFYDRNLSYSVGDFGGKLQGERLILPQTLEHILHEGNISRASHFLVYLIILPPYFSTRLNWDVEDVLHARKILMDKLVGRVDQIPCQIYDSEEDAT